MSSLSDQIEQWNNPALGAYCIWRFLMSLNNSNQSNSRHSGVLTFFMIGMIFDTETSESISNSRPNLQSYARGFEERKQMDFLIRIQESICDKMNLCAQSIDFGVAAGMIKLDISSGEMFAYSIEKKPKRGTTPKGIAAKLGKKAEILGKWFSEHETPTICEYLKVAL